MGIIEKLYISTYANKNLNNIEHSLDERAANDLVKISLIKTKGMKECLEKELLSN